MTVRDALHESVHIDWLTATHDKRSDLEPFLRGPVDELRVQMIRELRPSRVG